MKQKHSHSAGEILGFELIETFKEIGMMANVMKYMKVLIPPETFLLWHQRFSEKNNFFCSENTTRC